MKYKLYGIARWLCVAAITVVIIVSSVGAGKSAADAEVVFESVASVINTEGMTKADRIMIKRLFGIDVNDYESVHLLYPSDNMGAKELLIVKLKDDSDMNALIRAVDERLSTQKKSFEGYGVEQFALLTDKSVCETTGNFLIFVVSDEYEHAIEAFRNAI